MPRSPAEATRFTATGPYAHSKTTASTISLSTPPPPNETPAQKVARLRDASRKAKMEHETTWDRIVLRGRVWADRAHKVTTLILIGGAILAAGVGAISLGEMMMTNRSKKSEWYKEQEENYEKALALARKAEADGTLTENLRMFLVKQRAIEQAEAEQAAKGTLLEKAKEKVFAGLSLEDKPGGALGIMNGVEAGKETATGGISEAIRSSRAARTEELSPEVVIKSSEPAELKAADQIRSQLATPLVSAPRGGPLDRLAEQTATSMSESTKRWFGWR